MNANPNRRQLLAVAAAPLLAGEVAQAQPAEPEDPFTYSLNTATIRGQNLSIVDEVDIAARAGYQGIEPWVNEIDRYVQQGGTLRDLSRRIRDAGLRVENLIGFPEWVVDDDARRTRGLEEARRAMDLVRQLGGHRLAAPPAGATTTRDLPLARAAERYRALLELGDRMEVTPQVEVWGFSQSLGRLGECALVAIEANHPRACVLADVYHLHKGGSGFRGLRLLSAAALQVFHMNDFPAQPMPAELTDAHRVYPGDGVAPLRDMLRELHRAGFRSVLSLELFNRDYWRQDALTVARTGLQKMREIARASLQG